jgi:hypothetical protein
MNPAQFPYPLMLRVVPRWELYSATRFHLIRKRPHSYGLRARLFNSKRQLYELTAPFSFLSTEIGAIVVPAGFWTDFGSVPALTKNVVDDDDPDLLFGSLPHDDLYNRKGQLPDGRKITRLQADRMLREAMLACGSPSLKANIVYNAVRIGNIGAGW